MSVNTDFATWLKEQLKERGWSQARLAKEAHISVGAVGKILKKQSIHPEPETLTKIASAFQIAPETLFSMMGWLPADEEEVLGLRDALFLASQMTPSTQAIFLEIGRVLVEKQEKKQ